MNAKEFYEMYDIPHPKKCLPREDLMCQKLTSEIEDLTGQLRERDSKEIKKLNASIQVLQREIRDKKITNLKHYTTCITFSCLLVACSFISIDFFKSSELNRLREIEKQKTVYKESNPFIPFGMGVITAFGFYKLLDR